MNLNILKVDMCILSGLKKNIRKFEISEMALQELTNKRQLFICLQITLLFNLFTLTSGEVDNFQGLWFDIPINFQQSDTQNKLRSSDLLSSLKDGVVANLASKFRQDLGFPLLSESEDVRFACLNDTEKLVEDLTSKEQYAVRFLDADGKLPPGFLQGGWSWVGDYQECNSIESSFNNFTNHNFKGKYFSVALYINEKPLIGMYGLTIGVCLPDSCDTSDARALAEVAFAPLSVINASVAYVIADETPSFDGAAIATFVVIGIVGTLVVLGTSVELWIMYSHSIEGKAILMNGDTKYGAISSKVTEGTGLLADGILQDDFIVTRAERAMKFLLCFSFISNTKKLLNTRTANGPLVCLNGLRVISMWWVIQGHTYEFSTLTLGNVIYAESTLVKRFTFQAIVNGSFSVDTFFFLSGLLVAYLALRGIREQGKFNWVYYFLHRYWRLTPLYAFVMLIFMSLFMYLIAGPFQWLATDPDHGVLYEATHGCRNYWWSNLLYINNFYPDYGVDSGCMGWAWYLANDMQFYMIISPILIILFKYHKIAGFVTGLSLIIAGVAIRGFLVSWYGIQMLGGVPTTHADDPWGNQGLYVRPWARMSVYIVGFLTGFCLHSIRCRLKMNKAHSALGWCLAIGTALTVVYGMYDYNKNGTVMSPTASGFYVSLSRTAWSLSLAWLVLACATGHGGPVNWFLSWKIWAPLGRLTYAAYIVHPIILVCYQLNLLTSLHFTDLTLIYIFVSNLIFTYLFAYVVSMAVEAPMMAIEKFLSKRV